MPNKTRAHNVIGPTRYDRLDDFLDVGGIVLAIAVELNGDIVPIPISINITCLNAAADAQICHQIDMAHLFLVEQEGRSVGRGVVNNQNVVLRIFGQLVNNGANIRLFVISGNNHKHPCTIR